MVLGAEGTASTRALGSVRGAGNRPGDWHGPASLEGDSDGAQVMGAVRKGSGAPPALPQCSACLAGIFGRSPRAPGSLPVVSMTHWAGGFLGPLELLFQLWGRLLTLPHTHTGGGCQLAAAPRCWINTPSPSPPRGSNLHLKVTNGMSCTGSQGSPEGPGPSCPWG